MRKDEKKHVVFISLPMSGLNEDVIKDHIEEAKAFYLRKSGMDIKRVAFVDTLDNPHPPIWMPDKMFGAWYLGYSITKLSQCDECFFYSGWTKARGCRIEHEVCQEYDIPISYMSYTKT